MKKHLRNQKLIKIRYRKKFDKKLIKLSILGLVYATYKFILNMSVYIEIIYRKYNFYLKCNTWNQKPEASPTSSTEAMTFPKESES